MLVQIDSTDPESWLIGRVADQFRKGGVVVVPTDTVYGLACCISSSDAIQRIYDLKRMDPKKPLSILVGDMQSVGRYARGVSTPAYRVMKRVLPGPYTLIFQASAEVPKIMLRKRRTIGIRMPDDAIVQALLAELHEPLLSTSIRNPDDDFMNDPNEIEIRYASRVDLVVDGGRRLPVPSTVVDLSGDDPVLIREGKGDVTELQLFDQGG
jgi:tRNA threonylcarbamoyl adenosine modification protein (Sua5/YciO/YrdC/YwlC family)